MRRIVFATALICALPAMAQAQTYRAVNDLNVVPLGGTTFEVIEARGEGPRGIWCAAAEYAERRLGAGGRVYISEGRGPARSAAGRKSVVFTTNAANLTRGPFKSVSVSTSSVGVGLPVAHAIQFCRDIYDNDKEIWDRSNE